MVAAKLTQTGDPEVKLNPVGRSRVTVPVGLVEFDDREGGLELKKAKPDPGENKSMGCVWRGKDWQSLKGDESSHDPPPPPCSHPR